MSPGELWARLSRGVSYVLEKTVLIWLKSNLHNGRPGASMAEAEGNALLLVL